MTLVAGLLPALRATSVPPISAVREGATLPRSRFARLKPYAAGVVTALGLGLIAVGMSAGGGASSILASLGAGTLLLFTGVAMMSSHLVKPLARVVGLPARRLGGSAGRLATQNSVRNPGRTASTAAALMIGLALVTFVATLGSGLKDSVTSQIEDQAKADYVVTSSTNEGTFPKAADRALASAPGVTVASSVRADKAKVLGEETSVVGVDPATIASVYHFDWEHGSDAAVRQLGDGAIVDSRYAKDNHLRPGSRLRVQTPAGEFHSYVVKATYDAPRVQPLFTGVLISQRSFDRDFPHAKNVMAFADGGRRCGRAARAGRVPGRAGRDQGRLRRPCRQGRQHVAGDVLRPARAVGRRVAVRHGQHDDPVGVRAHA